MAIERVYGAYDRRAGDNIRNVRDAKLALAMSYITFFALGVAAGSLIMWLLVR